MKVAICLSGLIGGTTGRNGEGGNINPALCFNQWAPIIKYYNADVFIHSWSQEEEKSLQLFKPKRIFLEKQKHFDPKFEYYNHDLNSIEDLKSDKRYSPLLNAYSEDELWNHLKGVMWRSHSKHYSSKKVITLKRQYEIENNFEYDYVILSRFDLYISPSFLSVLDFKKLSRNYIYVSPRTDYERKRIDYDIAYHDLFIFGNSSLMDKFSLLYDNIYDYCLSPPHAIREHIDRFIGKEKTRLSDARFHKDYSLLRYVYNKEELKL